MNIDLLSREFWSETLFFAGGACVVTGVVFMGHGLV
jgi:hypothetical protein